MRLSVEKFSRGYIPKAPSKGGWVKEWGKEGRRKVRERGKEGRVGRCKREDRWRKGRRWRKERKGGKEREGGSTPDLWRCTPCKESYQRPSPCIVLVTNEILFGVDNVWFVVSTIPYWRLVYWGTARKFVITDYGLTTNTLKLQVRQQMLSSAYQWSVVSLILVHL